MPEILANATGRGYDYQLVTLGEYEQAQFAAGIDDVTEYFLVGSFISWLVALGSLVLLSV